MTQELSQLQGSHQALEQQLDQTRTKLTQEIQQSKKDLNVLQADVEKVTFPDHLLCGSMHVCFPSKPSSRCRRVSRRARC